MLHPGAMNPSKAIVSCEFSTTSCAYPVTKRVTEWLRRHLRWKWISVAISVALVASACFFLVRLLGDVDLSQVIDVARATPPRHVLAALCLVTASYVTLTFYDWFALRAIGRRDVPYRIAALAGLMSYAIGHGVGAMALTSGIVRYRVYSGWGLRVIDVAKVGFITGLTFWLGNIVMLGASLAAFPEIASRINGLPAWGNRTAAVVTLAAVSAYLFWLTVRPRAIGRREWRVTLPNARRSLIQIGIGVLDLSLAATAMYVLLPVAVLPGYMTVVVTFVAATLLGFVSHAPSGIGVFDAALLVGLPQVPPQHMLASILIYRALYFVLPLSAALLVLIVREFLGSVRPR